MGLIKIICEDCGRERTTRRKNTKYCLTCRLHRNLEFIGDQTRKCPACGETFAPLDRNELMCGNCSPKKAVGDPRDICGFCQQEKDLIVDEVKICHPCASDPANRDQFRVAMALKVKANREAND